MKSNLLTTQLGRFRILAFMEGTSFLLILFVTMPLKYMYQMPQPNQVIGMVHGILFVFYVLAVIQLHFALEWKKKMTFLALLASIIPFGTFYLEYKYLRD